MKNFYEKKNQLKRRFFELATLIANKCLDII